MPAVITVARQRSDGPMTSSELTILPHFLHSLRILEGIGLLIPKGILSICAKPPAVA